VGLRRAFVFEYQPFVVVVNRDRQDLLGLALGDDVFVELADDAPGGRDLFDKQGRRALWRVAFVDDRVADLDTGIADVDPGTAALNELFNLELALVAERTSLSSAASP
ncbi:uncharacterized protein METZ01_LOCUS414932, partial [marine metagenome]